MCFERPRVLSCSSAGRPRRECSQLGVSARLAEAAAQMAETYICVTGPGTPSRYNRTSSSVSSESGPIPDENVPAAYSVVEAKG